MNIPLDFCCQGNVEPIASLDHDAAGEQECGVRGMAFAPT